MIPPEGQIQELIFTVDVHVSWHTDEPLNPRAKFTIHTSYHAIFLKHGSHGSTSP